jgi:class 3 adenylate cyclase
VVNVTARIESQTKVAGHPLLFSESTKNALTEPTIAIELPPAEFKGKTGPSRLFTAAPLPAES